MALSQNKAVRKAYDDGVYTDKNGKTWDRGMDGWFLRDFPHGIMLCRHHDFVAMVEEENKE